MSDTDWQRLHPLSPVVRGGRLTIGIAILLAPDVLLGRNPSHDLVQIVVDRLRLEGSVDLIGADGRTFGPEEGARVLAGRSPRADLAPDPKLPDDTRLWAALQQAGGGAWGGCVYDVDAIIRALSPR